MTVRIQLPVFEHLYYQAAVTSVLGLLATKSCEECLSLQSKKRSSGATRLSLESARTARDLKELALEGGGEGKAQGRTRAHRASAAP